MKTIQEVELKSVAKIIMGTSPKGNTYNNTGNGLPLINGPTEFGDSHPDCTLFTTKFLKACEVGDLIFCVRGSTTGRMNWANKKYSLGRGVCSIRGKTQTDTIYIRYCIEQSLDRLLQLASGATFPNLTKETIFSFKIPYPDDRERVVDIIQKYDILANTNRRRIQLLEEAARLLFREWFVYFRFPGHEKVKIVDGVPKGWERKPISVLTSFLNRGIAPHYDEDADGLVINQKCIRGGRLDVSLVRRQSREFKPDRQLQTGDVLINSTGEGTLGRVAQVLAPIANCTVDTHVTIARPIPEIGVHYFGQSLMAWEPHLSTMGRGATNQTELSRGQIGEIDILVPLHSLVQQFEEYSEPIFLQVSTLLEQNQKLKAARDLLLPRLMSGKIDVSEFDIKGAQEA